MKNESPWYKNAVFYQLHVKCFCDSNQDGIGDFKGLKSKLDYIQNLGCTAIWLQPFYPSPLKDDGYDIASYVNIHSDYGTLHDFKECLKEAHRRNLKVVTELVINHTSDQHPWFQRARRSPKNSVYHQYYMWSDTADKYPEARIIFKDFETSNWEWDPLAKRYYWHRFYSHQPDLNYDSPQVHKEIFKIVDFWLGMGIDGMRLDAVPYLFAREGTDCENLPQTHAFLKNLRAYVDRKYPGRMLLAEANQWPEDAHKYFGDDDECHMAFHFPVMPRLFMALKLEERYPIIDIMEQTPEPPLSGQWAIFLRNHDELTLEMVTDEERDYMWRVYANDPRARINLGIRRRLAPLLDNERAKIELMNILLFSLPGSPILYYGDEIGMGDNYYLGDRNGVRTPMQWNNDRNAGFSQANPQMLYLPLIIDPEYHHEYLNVENQEITPSSLLWWMRNAISIREQSLALGLGKLTFLRPANPKVLVLLRENNEETVLVVANLSRYAQQVQLTLQGYFGRTPVDLFSQNRFGPIGQEPYTITLGRYGYYWLKLEKAAEPMEMIETKNLPKLSATKKWEEIFSGRKLLPSAIRPFLLRSRWFRSKMREISKVTIQDRVKVDSSYLLLINVQFSDALSEIYVLPVCVTENKSAFERYPQAAIAEIQIKECSYYLIDAVYNEAFRKHLFLMALKGKRIQGTSGVFKGTPASGLSKIIQKKDFPTSRVLKGEQTNTSVIYDQKIMLKIYRQVDEEENIEVSLLRYLSGKGKYQHVPPYRGDVTYAKRKKTATLAVLLGYIENSGDLWTLTLDAIRRFFEESLSQENIQFTDVWYTEMIEKLAKRTAELHLTLLAAEQEALKPEPFTIHYQKALYQAMKGQLQRNLSFLRNYRPEMDEENKKLASSLLDKQPQISALFDTFMATRFEFSKIRIHGDFHLGQVLHSRNELILIDFEGEPAIPISQRRLKKPALQDVAGIIRSFHYAVQSVLNNYHESVREKLAPIADLWYTSIEKQFVRSYLDILEKKTSPLVPKDPIKRRLLLRALLAHKALYEIGYELQNRPQWVVIPIKGMLKILEEKDVDAIKKPADRA